MKKFISILALILSVGVMEAQVLTLKAGTTISDLDYKIDIDNSGFGSDLFEETDYGYYMTLGLEYLETEYYNLSSSIGYLQRGGKQEIPVTSTRYPDGTGEFTTMVHDFNYFTVNTLAKIKLPTQSNLSPFFTAGPRIDIFTGGGKTLKENNNEFVYGAILGAGLMYDLPKTRLGLNAEYYLDFVKLRDYQNEWAKTEMTGTLFTLSFSVGYKL